METAKTASPFLYSTTTTPGLLTSSHSSPPSSSTTSSTFYNASYCNEDWTQILTTTPFKSPIDVVEDGKKIDDDDGDDDDDDLVDDDVGVNLKRQSATIENRILKSVSVLAFFLVFVVVLLGGVNNSMQMPATSGMDVVVLDAAKVAKNAADRDAAAKIARPIK